MEHQFVGARDKAGLPETLVLYGARHTYATDALAGTVNVAAVMDTMGHANVQTKMIYQHQGLEQIRNAINLRNKENPIRQIGTCVDGVCVARKANIPVLTAKTTEAFASSRGKNPSTRSS